MATADEGTHFGVPGTTGNAPEADLARRVAELEATVARLTEALKERATPPAPGVADVAATWPAVLPHPAADQTVPPPVDLPHTGPTTGPAKVEEPTGVDRRRLLTRAGTAAVGAVVGGAAAGIAAASPAAAASASFDTSSSTPAVDAVSTGTGSAVRARNDAAYTGQAEQPLAFEAQGFSRLNGQVVVGDARFDSMALLRAQAPQALATGVSASGRIFGVEGNSDGFGVWGFSQAGVGTVGVSYDGIGVIASEERPACSSAPQDRHPSSHHRRRSSPMARARWCSTRTPTCGSAPPMARQGRG